jgi:hypothetical protein
MGPLLFILIAMLVVKVFGNDWDQVTFQPGDGLADPNHPLIGCGATAGGAAADGYPHMDCYGTFWNIDYGANVQGSWPANEPDAKPCDGDRYVEGCVEHANFFKNGLEAHNMVCSNYGTDLQPERLLYAMRGLPMTFLSLGGTTVTVKLNYGAGMHGFSPNSWIGGPDCIATADYGVLQCDGTYSDGSAARPAVSFQWIKGGGPMEFEIGVYDRPPEPPQPTFYPTAPHTPWPTRPTLAPTKQPTAPTRNYNPDCLRAPHTQMCQDHVLWLRANWNLTAGPFPGVVNPYEDAGVDGTDCTILQYLSTAQNDTWCNCLCPEL